MIRFTALLLILITSFSAACAADLSAALRSAIDSKGSLRFDKTFKDSKSKVYLPLVPAKPVTLKYQDGKFINAESSDGVKVIYQNEDGDYVFSNGWLYTPITKNTVKSLKAFDIELQNLVLKSHINDGFVVPSGFKLPRDLAITAGSLPIEFRISPVDTDKELEFIKRKAALNIDSIDFLTYDYKSGSFIEAEFDLAANKVRTIDGAKLWIEDLALLSRLKTFHGESYLADYVGGVIYQLNQYSYRQKEKNPNLPKYFLTKVLKLEAENAKHGLRDFIVNVRSKRVFVLLDKSAEVQVYDLASSTIVNKYDVPLKPSSLIEMENSNDTLDRLIVLEEQLGKVYILSAIDQRKAKSHKLDVPMGSSIVAYDVHRDKLYMSLASIDVKQSASELVAFDFIKQRQESILKLEQRLTDLKISKDGRLLYALSQDKNAFLVIDIPDAKILHSIDLGADISKALQFTYSASHNTAMVPSATNSTVAIIDLTTYQIVKKIKLDKKASSVFALN